MPASPLPFEPRPLTQSERRRGDLYLLNSPKLGRRVEIISCIRTALFLTLEFNSDLESFVERPRILESQGKQIELDFWCRAQGGREFYYLVVPHDETLHSNSSRREFRNSRELINSAQQAKISIEFCFECELQKRSPILGTWYRLLPYVQTAVSLPNRWALRAQVMAVFDTVDRANFKQIESALNGFHAADVRAVVVDLVHAGQLLLVDPAKLSRFGVLERRTPNGQT